MADNSLPEQKRQMKIKVRDTSTLLLWLTHNQTGDFLQHSLFEIKCYFYFGMKETYFRSAISEIQLLHFMKRAWYSEKDLTQPWQLWMRSLSFQFFIYRFKQEIWKTPTISIIYNSGYQTPQKTNNESRSLSVVAVRGCRVTAHRSARPGQKHVTPTTVSQEFGRQAKTNHSSMTWIQTDDH